MTGGEGVQGSNQGIDAAAERVYGRMAREEGTTPVGQRPGLLPPEGQLHWALNETALKTPLVWSWVCEAPRGAQGL